MTEPNTPSRGTLIMAVISVLAVAGLAGSFMLRLAPSATDFTLPAVEADVAQRFPLVAHLSIDDLAAKLKGMLKADRLPVVENPSHIVPILVGDPVHCKAVTDALLDRFGIYAQPINYPTVRRGTERIRLTPTPLHTDAQMDALVAALSSLWAACPVSHGQTVRLAAE